MARSGAAHLLEGGAYDLGLGLVAGGADDTAGLSPAGQTGQQRCPAGAGLAAQGQDATVSLTHVEQQAVEHFLLPGTPAELGC